MHRFYIPNVDIPGFDAPNTEATSIEATQRAIKLDGPVARQLKTVLRAETGDRIGLFDGSGSEWEVEINHVSRAAVSTMLVSAVKPVPEPSVKVTMLLGLARPERIELAIQKCTELGAVRFMPVMSERVQGGPRLAIGKQARPLAAHCDRGRRTERTDDRSNGRSPRCRSWTPLTGSWAIDHCSACGRSRRINHGP